MLLPYLRENDARLQLHWRQPWATVHVGVTVSAVGKYDSNMAVFLHCIHPI